MTSMFETSATVSWLRRAVKGSIVCAPFLAVGRMLRHVDDGVARAIAEKNRGQDEDAARVRQLVAGSWLVRAVDRVFTLPIVAWDSSAVARWLRPVIHEVRAMPRWQQVRLVGWMLMVGLLSHAASYVLLRESIGSMTLVTWGGTALVAIVLMAWSRELVVAWRERFGRPSPRSDKP